MKLFKYAVLIFASLIWLSGISPTVFEFLGKHHLMQDGYQFGDLFRLSNLSAFKQRVEPCVPEKPSRHASSKKVHLYIIGDSFTTPERIDPASYAADSIIYHKWDYPFLLDIDTSVTNILLMECVERHFRQKFDTPQPNFVQYSATNSPATQHKPFIQKLESFFDSKAVEGRLDMLLFQNDLIMYAKQWKADFNYYVFDRVTQDARLVNQDRDMVYMLDVDTPSKTSSFSTLDDAEVDAIVMNLEKSQILAKQAGFDHVILSIIPNKVSVVAPDYGPYNHLIERIYASPSLTVPNIDVFQDFKKMGTASYLKSDTHWTCEAEYLWLAKTNLLINNLLAAH
jgi:hypothetical protein